MWHQLVGCGFHILTPTVIPHTPLSRDKAEAEVELQLVGHIVSGADCCTEILVHLSLCMDRLSRHREHDMPPPMAGSARNRIAQRYILKVLRFKSSSLIC